MKWYYDSMKIVAGSRQRKPATILFYTSNLAHETKGARKERREAMKKWAEAFYLSKSWEQCRDAYLESQNNICERCGEPAKICHHRTWLTRENINNPYVTLCWDNLEALCQDCHNKEHHKKKPKLRYSFDEEGNIVYTPLSSEKN